MKVLITLCNKFDKHVKLLNDEQRNSFIMKVLEEHVMRWLSWNLPHKSQSTNEKQKELISLINSHILNVTDTMFKVERKKGMNKK